MSWTSGAPARLVAAGLNIRDHDADARAFVRQHRLTYPQVSDPSGAMLLEFPDGYPSSVPSTTVIGPDGRLRAAVFGEVSIGTLRALIGDVQAER